MYSWHLQQNKASLTDLAVFPPYSEGLSCFCSDDSSKKIYFLAWKKMRVTWVEASSRKIKNPSVVCKTKYDNMFNWLKDKHSKEKR